MTTPARAGRRIAPCRNSASSALVTEYPSPLVIACSFGNIRTRATLSTPKVEPLYIQDENGEAVVFIPYGNAHA